MSAGFFAVFDDIAMLLDDAATMGQIATKKTAGVLADDLAVNAQKASGFSASRELPVLWRISKGSFINKLIILPFVFLLSSFAPWAIISILMMGGVYLAYEGAEKIYEYFVPHQELNIIENINISEENFKEYEDQKVKSAILTDFILSIEIIIIALGTVFDESLAIQIIVVSTVSIIATIGVYGVVALIIRMDDVGFWLKDRGYNLLGSILVKSLPKIIKALTVIGTLAMLLVAGGIFLHNIEYFHHFLTPLSSITSILIEFFSGLVIGFLALFLKRGVSC
ncbi:MAG: DUF808 domain-containing protein [Sulfurovum sp.]|nr:DUF808 domain-containing protein [Sulfurovaceae bacterium]